MYTLPIPTEKILRFVALFVGSILLFVSATEIYGESNAKDLKISGDEFSGSLQGGATIKGNVELRQDSLLLKCDSIELVVENDEIKRMDATGEPATIQFEFGDEDQKQQVRAQAKTITILRNENQVQFLGSARVTSANVDIESETIRLDLNTNEIVAESLDQEEQVEITLRNTETF